MKITKLFSLLSLFAGLLCSSTSQAQATIAGWDFAGVTSSGNGYGAAGMPATTTAGGVTNTNLHHGNYTVFKSFTNSVGGSAFSYSTDAFGGNPTNSADSTTAINGGYYFLFTVKPGTGNSMSLSNLQLGYHIETFNPTTNMNMLVQYAVGNGAFQSIENVVLSTIGSGAANYSYQHSLSSFANLQNVTDSVTFRIVPYKSGQTNIIAVGYAFWFGNANTAGDDLMVTGTVTAAGPQCSSITPGTLSAANDTICAGTNTTLTLNNSAPAVGVNYQWKSSTNATSGFTNVGNNATNINTGTLSATTYYKCIVSCASGTAIDSTPVKMVFVKPNVIPAVSIASPNSTTTNCPGATITFNATPANEGTSPSYVWKEGLVTYGTTTVPTFSYSNFTAGAHAVTCTMTSNATCVSPTTATSSAVNFTMTQSQLISMGLTSDHPSITNDGTSPVSACPNSAVLFTAQGTGAAGSTYTWKKGTTTIATHTAIFQDTLTISNLTASDVITCTINTTQICPNPPQKTSNSISVNLLPAVTPTVSLTANPAGAICPGTAVTFTGASTNGGTTPLYTWTKGGNVVGNNPTYTDNGLTDGDVIICQLTSSAACVTSTSVNSAPDTIHVNPAVTPAITISSTPGDTVCSGTAVIFTAAATGIGTAPTYTWRRNNLIVGSNSVYTESTPTNGEIVNCFVTTNAACATKPADTSANITLAVNAVVNPTISISANPGTNISANQSVTFNATTGNAGTNATYQWKKNGTNVGNSAASFTTNTLIDNDTVYCVIHSNAPCGPDSVVSNKLIIHVSTGVSQVNATHGVFNLYPNPNSGDFTIIASELAGKTATLQISNLVGQIIYSENASINNGAINKQINLPAKYPSGVYLLRVKTEEGENVIRFLMN
ncbi:T9SS type A sorting domain-containing protein [Taibaiella soli]|uniref:Ig-like domain-containing protein n=1 Tax=Taibaiella soli TaxID=1649169 RepID=A0A2W2AD77_9BACT|nr:T9SS type A sorting domain-containing protein [Taibaiella soli]PZF73405.1 hypothetical protein DN068_08415 [Taibaiella soli]